MNDESKKGLENDKFRFITMDELLKEGSNEVEHEVVEDVEISSSIFEGNEVVTEIEVSNEVPEEHEVVNEVEVSNEVPEKQEVVDEVEVASEVSEEQKTVDEVEASSDVFEDQEVATEVVSEEAEEEKTDPVDDTHEFIAPIEDKNSKSLKCKIHFSFEARVFVMTLFIILLFVSSFVALSEAFRYHADDTISFDEVSDVKYKVCYQTEGDCSSDDQAYLSSLMGTVDVDFQYNVDFSEKVNYDFTYHVSAVTKIYDTENPNKIYYQKEDYLVDLTDISVKDDKFSISPSVSLDFNTYNNFVADYTNIYSTNPSSYVEVVLYADKNDEVQKLASVTIPLNVETYQIKKYSFANKNRTLDSGNVSWNNYNTFSLVVSFLLFAFGGILLYRTVYFVKHSTVRKNRYQDKLEQILSDYDRLIVVARDGYTSIQEMETIKVDSFDQLLTIRDSLQKPIVYTKINESKSEFLVEDDHNKLYKYVLKESDL